MSRADILKARLFALAQCFALIADLLGNALVSIPTGLWAVLSGQEGAPPCFTETMSARAGRAWLNQKLWARLTVPLIDWMFSWQAPVAELPYGRTFVHPSHSLRAFIKTREGAYLPPAYHGPLPPSLEACYRERE